MPPRQQKDTKLLSLVIALAGIALGIYIARTFLKAGIFKLKVNAMLLLPAAAAAILDALVVLPLTF